MRCVDCELHDCIVGTHFCNYRGKSGRRRPRRVSEEDAHKDVPCEYVEEVKVAILLSLADDHTKVVLSPKQMEIAERLMRGENDEDR